MGEAACPRKGKGDRMSGGMSASGTERVVALLKQTRLQMWEGANKFCVIELFAPWAKDMCTKECAYAAIPCALKRNHKGVIECVQISEENPLTRMSHYVAGFQIPSAPMTAVAARHPVRISELFQRTRSEIKSCPASLMLASRGHRPPGATPWRPCAKLCDQVMFRNCGESELHGAMTAVAWIYQLSEGCPRERHGRVWQRFCTSMASYGRGENAPDYGLEIGAVGMAAVAA